MLWMEKAYLFMMTPHPPARFELPRVFLRPVTIQDAEKIFHGYFRSEPATRFMNFTRQTTLEEALSFAERCERCWQDGLAYPWAVIARQSDEFLGVVELRMRAPKADFGYVFCPQFWGQGFASEAVKAIADWAFFQPDIYRIWATCHPDNIASVRVLQKAGLQFEARLENWEPRPQLDEIAGPSLVYARTKLTAKTTSATT
jgi:RimJ/RimL family protein N-acetyltransferase